MLHLGQQRAHGVGLAVAIGVALEQDRQRAERSLADTEYLAREVVALRLAMEDLATKEFVRDELKDLLKDLLEELAAERTGTKPATRKAPRGVE